MTTDKFSDSLNALLSEGRLGYAIDVLRGKCAAALPAHPGLGEVMTALDRAADTYARLRDFMLRGLPDPDRPGVYASLKDTVRDLARRYLFIVNEGRSDAFFADYRVMKLRGVTVAGLLDELKKVDFRLAMARETEAGDARLRQRREDILDDLFRRVWSLPPWATDDFKALSELLADADTPFDVYSQVVSALLMGLLKFNDPEKMLLLVRAYEGTPSERLAARALTALVIVIGRWGRSAVSAPAVAKAVERLEGSLLTYSRVREVVRTLIRTRDTDRVSREVTEAFNSTMKEITPEMLDRLRREGLSADAAETGMNPEWEKLLHNKEVEEKMKAINDMQLEGMDVMMQTFSRLKSFPFFRRISNWFLPFSAEHSAVEPLFHTFNAEGFTVMADATDMCAGDRYSFALGLLQMPEDRRNMMSMTLGGQLEMLKDLTKDRENVRRKPEFATEALVYARDLYRFAKLFPAHSEFYDPFEAPIDFLKLPLLGSLLEGDDIILESADFYFRHGYHTLALALYEVVEGAGKADRELYEKIAFCRQMEGDMSGALRDYERADLFSSDADRSSVWLMKKLAFCNKALGRYDRAADYYRRLLELNPDDLRLEFHLGSVLLRGGHFEEGRALISKVHYLDPSHEMAARIGMRLKGHDAFAAGRLREALGLYEAARGDQPAPEYRRDLAGELIQLYPDADVESLFILLD